MDNILVRSSVLLVIACLLISGCSEYSVAVPQIETAAAMPLEATPESGHVLEQMDLGDVSIENGDERSYISLYFYNTSQSGDITPVKTLPAYKVTYVEGLDRIILRLDNVTSASFPQRGIRGMDDRVQAVFHILPKNGDVEMLLIIHLKEHCTLRLTENEDNLQLEATSDPEDATLGDGWYVQINDTGLYPINTDLANMGFSPSLCIDGVNAVLLSNRFETRDEAGKFLETQSSSLSKLMPDALPVVTCIASGSLPTWEIDADFADTVSGIAVFPDGTTCSGDTFINNGRFLAWSPDGNSCLFSRINKLDDGSDYTYEQLFIMTEDAVDSILPDVEFSLISSATFSSDGRYIAFLDYAEICRSLLVYDRETKTLYNGDEIGFGVDTPAYAWNGNQPILYAITGEGEALSMCGVDMRNPGSLCWESREIFPDEGSFDYEGGYLYFCKSNEMNAESWIYRINVTSLEYETVTEGSSFAISHGTGNMVVVWCEDIRVHLSETHLKLFSLHTMTGMELIEIPDIMHIIWDSNKEDFYVLSYRDAPLMDENQMILWKFSTSTFTVSEALYIQSGDLFSSNLTGEALLAIHYTQGDTVLYITYRLPVS